MITTVNIQHLESLADAVEQMTGVQVRERVPDWVVRKADQIELVDSSPEQLRRRMVHGNIYPQEKVPQALTHFFRTDNLIALRELALRFLADETDEELLEHLGGTRSEVLWETTRTDPGGGDRALRGPTRCCAGRPAWPPGSRRTQRGPRDQRRCRASVGRRRRRGRAAAWPRDTGAHWHEVRADDPGKALIGLRSRRTRSPRSSSGSSQRSRWQELIGRDSIVRTVRRLAASAGIDLHIIARHDESTEPQTVNPPEDSQGGSSRL